MIAATKDQLRAYEDALRRGARHIGWKIARDFPEIEAVIGKQAVLGHLTSASVLPSGAEVAVSRLREPRVETELVIELAATVRSDSDRRAIRAAIAGTAVGLELVDVARPPDDLEGIIAANVAHRACVIGATRPGPPAAGPAHLWVNRARRESAAAPADCTDAIATAARVLEAVGRRLEPGDRILAGALIHVPAAAGDHVAAEIEGLGTVELTLRQLPR
ncbi:MAG TPA: fumarylacetoacetate hydrolase family protein [Solirubrobacteraceae bacterium]|nr:fumarylacetoacetate hydrolase family protein [Solirubrobacteraceae bacterium]